MSVEQTLYDSSTSKPPFPVSDDGRWLVPRSLKIVAVLFILTGALSSTEAILQWIVFSRLHVDVIGILALFVGRGLLRWQNGWRYAAIFITWMYLVGAGIVLGISFWKVIAPKSLSFETFHIGSQEVGPGSAAIAIELMMVVLAWQLYVLRRIDIARRFNMLRFKRLEVYGGVDPAAPPAKRWRFSLGTLFLAVIVICFVLARVGADDIWYQVHHETRTIGSRGAIHGFEYGYRTSRYIDRPDQLLYVLHSSENPWESHVYLPRGHDHKDATIKMPDGTMISFVANCQLYEIGDGELITHQGRISKSDLDSFWETSSKEWTIDALLEHAAKLRQSSDARE